MSRSLKAFHPSTLASLRLHGPDQKGIVAACSHALDKFGCGIVQSETWTDRFDHLFFQRILFNCGHRGSCADSTRSGSSGNIYPERILLMNDEMEQLKKRFGLYSMNINWRNQPKKVAVFVSKYDHCLVRVH